MFQGVLPTQDLLTANNLREFRPIVHAIKTGNLGLMEDALSKFEFFFVRTGIYLLGTGFTRESYINLVYVEFVCLLQ